MPRISERREYLDELETTIEVLLEYAVLEDSQSVTWRMLEDLLVVHEVLSTPRYTSPRGRTRRNNLKASRTAGRKEVAGTGKGSRSQDPKAIESGSRSTTERTPAARAPRERIPAEGEGSDGDIESDATPPRSTRTSTITQSPAPGRNGGSRTELVKRPVEERQSYELDRELKKRKIEQQMQKESLDAARTMQKECLAAERAIQKGRLEMHREHLKRLEVMHREHVEQLEVMHREHLEQLEVMHREHLEWLKVMDRERLERRDRMIASSEARIAGILADEQARQKEVFAQWIGSIGAQNATNELTNQPTS